MLNTTYTTDISFSVSTGNEANFNYVPSSQRRIARFQDCQSRVNIDSLYIHFKLLKLYGYDIVR